MRFVGRVALATLGLTIFSLGVTMNIQAGLGLQPWWALHYGLAQLTPLSIGVTSMVVGVLVIGAAWLLGVKPGISTGLNILIVGFATDALLEAGPIPKASSILEGYALAVGGVVTLGFGTAVYVKANLGAGPRDSLMLGLAYYLQGRVGLARNAMDLTVALAGWLMGGPIGIGTLISSFGTGPVVALWFKLLRVEVKRKPVVRRQLAKVVERPAPGDPGLPI